MRRDLLDFWIWYPFNGKCYLLLSSKNKIRISLNIEHVDLIPLLALVFYSTKYINSIQPFAPVNLLCSHNSSFLHSTG